MRNMRINYEWVEWSVKGVKGVKTVKQELLELGTKIETRNRTAGCLKLTSKLKIEAS